MDFMTAAVVVIAVIPAGLWVKVLIRLREEGFGKKRAHRERGIDTPTRCDVAESSIIRGDARVFDSAQVFGDTGVTEN